MSHPIDNLFFDIHIIINLSHLYMDMRSINTADNTREPWNLEKPAFELFFSVHKPLT